MQGRNLNIAVGFFVLLGMLAMLFMASGSLAHFLLSAAMTPLAFVSRVNTKNWSSRAHSHKPSTATESTQALFDGKPK